MATGKVVPPKDVFVGFITGKIVGLMVMKYKIMVRWGYNLYLCFLIYITP